LAANRKPRYGRANLHLHLFWLLPIDAMVERNGAMQAGANARHVSSALSRRSQAHKEITEHEIAEEADCGYRAAPGACIGKCGRVSARSCARPLPESGRVA